MRETVFREMAKRPDLPAVPQLVVNSSARHMHVSPENLEVLFGPGAKLEVHKWLYQEGQFAACFFNASKS